MEQISSSPPELLFSYGSKKNIKYLGVLDKKFPGIQTGVIIFVTLLNLPRTFPEGADTERSWCVYFALIFFL